MRVGWSCSLPRWFSSAFPSQWRVTQPPLCGQALEVSKGYNRRLVYRWVLPNLKPYFQVAQHYA